MGRYCVDDGRGGSVVVFVATYEYINERGKKEGKEEKEN